MIPESGWPDLAWRTSLLCWLAKRVRDAATVDDLAQETVLLAAAHASLGGKTGAAVEKLGFGIARNLVARERRRAAKGPRSNCEGDLRSAATPTGASCDPYDATREHLASIRRRLDPTLGPKQRALLTEYLDAQVTSVRELSRRHGTAPANVRRMLAGIAHRIIVLDGHRAEQ